MEQKYDARAVFRFIVAYKREHDGNAPTVRQIVQQFGISSTSMASLIIKRLASDGLVRRPAPGASRGIEVVGGTWRGPDGAESADTGLQAAAVELLKTVDADDAKNFDRALDGLRRAVAHTGAKLPQRKTA